MVDKILRYIIFEYIIGKNKDIQAIAAVAPKIDKRTRRGKRQAAETTDIKPSYETRK
jgi:hypothetical protein